MGKLLLSVVVGIAVAGAQEGPPPVRADLRPELSAGPTKRLWLTSVGALTMANVADAQSSWGKRELNPTLSGNAGTFGLGGTLIKAGIVGSMIGVEYLLLRRHPGKGLYRKVSIINFGAAALTGGVAAHNYTIPQR